MRALKQWLQVMDFEAKWALCRSCWTGLQKATLESLIRIIELTGVTDLNGVTEYLPWKSRSDAGGHRCDLLLLEQSNPDYSELIWGLSHFQCRLEYFVYFHNWWPIVILCLAHCCELLLGVQQGFQQPDKMTKWRDQQALVISRDIPAGIQDSSPLFLTLTLFLDRLLHLTSKNEPRLVSLQYINNYQVLT